MGNFRSSSTSKKTFAEACKDGQKNKHLFMPFTEQDIIFFQKMLVTSGTHYVVVENMTKGRKALFTLLSSINIYQRKACISTNFELIGEPIAYNLYGMLDLFQNKDRTYTFEQLWAEGQHFDFLWIERSSKDSVYFINLCKQAIEICSNKELCIIVMEEKI